MNRETFLLAFLLVVWWVGVWGFLETLLHMVHKGNPTVALMVYGALIFAVGIIVVVRPSYLEHFV